MPLFMMRDHLRVYLPPNDGPMLSTLYPPLSVLMYAPAAIFHSPRTAFFVAGLLSQLFCFVPLFIALRVASERTSLSRFHVLVTGTAFVLLCNLSEIMGTVYLVHADPPAICLAALAFVCLIAFIRSGRQHILVLAAVLASLAPWAKQTAVPVLILVSHHANL